MAWDRTSLAGTDAFHTSVALGVEIAGLVLVAGTAALRTVDLAGDVAADNEVEADSTESSAETDLSGLFLRKAF